MMSHVARRRARSRIALLLLLPVYAFGCDNDAVGTDSQTLDASTARIEGAKVRPSRTGTLQVAISGVPSGGTPSVSVAGPANSDYTLSSSQTLSGVRVGTYTIDAAPFTLAGTTYVANPVSQQVSVTRDLPTTAAIAYAPAVPAAGALTVAITGLPDGAKAAVTVTGPGGFSTTATATAALGSLTPGDYTISATAVSASGVTYEPAPASQSASVTAGGVATVSVTYAAATPPAPVDTTSTTNTSPPPPTVGALAVSVIGLPSGTGAGVKVSGPNGFSQVLSGSQTFDALAPGTYTVSATNVVSGSSTYVPAPATQSASVTAGMTASAAVTYSMLTTSTTPTPTPGAVNLRIDGLYITQSVQTYTRGVPLVAGRDGVVRVFALASAANSARPTVRVRLYRNGGLVATMTAQPAGTSVPTSVSEGTYSASWNVWVPGSVIQPGLSVVADVDPENGVAESDETDNQFPSTGTPLSLDVRAVPIFAVRLVPVVGASGQGNVSATNKEDFLRGIRQMYPVSTVDADVRAPYTTQSLDANSSDWSALLSEMNVLRSAEAGSTRNYYGVVKASYATYMSGIGLLGGRAALGWDSPTYMTATMAHETGHNFGRSHAPCGGVASPDASYPYPGGVIGAYGLDVATGQVMAPSTYDVMGYCYPRWVSDYTYKRIMDFRATQSGAVYAAAELAAPERPVQPCLVVWGRISGTGEVVLEPAFAALTNPSAPTRGRYTLEGTDESGARLFSLSFDGQEASEEKTHGERHFAIAVPMSEAAQSKLAALRVTGGGGRGATMRASGADAASDDATVETEGAGRVRVRWNRAKHPLVVVRDPATHQILSIARGGSAAVWTGRGDVDLTFSDGVKSTTRRAAVRGR